MKQCLRLRGISDEIKGRVWESDALLRAGRLSSLEIVLDDNSVSRRHAEIRYAPPAGWLIRDLDSTNGTFLLGQKLVGERPLHIKDIVQFGKVAMVVEKADLGTPGEHSNTVVDEMLVDSLTSNSWEDATQNLVYDRNHTLRPGEQLHALVQAAGHLIRIEKEDELLDSILHDVVHVLDAQRGAIVLWDAREKKLKLKRLATGHGDGNVSRFHYSQKIAQRCFDKHESILLQTVKEDPDLISQSISDGQMASVICAFLRTPHGPLGVLHLDRTVLQKHFTDDDLHLADALAALVSVGIRASMLLRKEKEQFQNTVRMLAQLVEGKDEYTGGHILRVTAYAGMLARSLGLSDKEVDEVELGTPLHDIGKIYIDDAILRKPGKLTTEEFEIMKTHVTEGAKVLATVEELHPIIPIVRHHHERWDGSGYPDGLKGDAIPLNARIVSVVDAFDAMTTERPYTKARPPEVAFAELQRMAGTQFDPNCVAAFVAIKPQIIEAMTSENRTAIIAAIGKSKDANDGSQHYKVQTQHDGDPNSNDAKTDSVIPPRHIDSDKFPVPS